MPDDVRKHSGAAMSDLYFGPKGPDYWREELDDPSAPDYSFTKSCKIVADWFDSVDWPSYVDEDGYAQRFSYLEEWGVPYYEVTMADLKRELFGELASYIS